MLAYRYSHVAHPTLREVQQKLADVATVAQENIVGVHVVKAFAQEPAEQEKFRARSEAVFRQTLQANRQRALYVPLISFVPMLAQAGVLLVGARMVDAAATSRSAASSPSTSTSACSCMPLRSLGMWIGQAQRATASGERIFQVMDEPEEVADRPDAVELPPGPGARPLRGRLVRVPRRAAGARGRRPRRRARPDRRADRPHRLGQDDARPRSSPASTTRPPGRVTGRRPRRPRPHARVAPPRDRRHLAGSVPLLGDGAGEHRVRAPATSRTRRSRRVARAAQAHEFIERLPQGYDTVIGERGITLSGGQRQRLAIARALAVDPRILILDDATASVDASTEALIRIGLRGAMQGRTTFIIAHRLSTIALADEIVVLDDGRVAARGQHDELLATSAVYREIYEHGLLERQFADAVEARAAIEEVA